MRDRALAVLFAAVVCIALVVLFTGWQACQRVHGHYVRGLFGMECVR